MPDLEAGQLWRSSDSAMKVLKVLEVSGQKVVLMDVATGKVFEGSLGRIKIQLRGYRLVKN